MKQDENQNWQNLVNKQKSHSETDNKIKSPEHIDSYIFIFDCYENKILYINNAFTTITDNDTNIFDLDFLIDMIHPDDQNYFFKSEEKGLNFTNKLLFNEHFKYILSYSYRIRRKCGEYITVRQQCQALEVNTSGHLTKTLVIHKIIDNYTTRPTDDYKIFDKSQNIYIDEENCYNLSKREFEILNLIKQGLNSQDISESLNISKKHGYNTSKNILTKTNCNSFIELIKKISTNPF